MPVPWETLLPFGLFAAFFTASGSLLRGARHISNDWKNPRYGMDSWEEMMMERDERLTGKFRGQSIEATAPPSFANSKEISTVPYNSSAYGR